MKKTLISTFLFLIFFFFITISYLSFFGYETDRFNKIINSEIKKTNKDIAIDFKKISILLDIKNMDLLVKFINPKLNLYNTSIPLKLLKTQINLDFLTKKKIVIRKIILSTEYLDFNKTKPLFSKIGLRSDNLKNIIRGEFEINDLKLEFDKNFELKKDLKIQGSVKNAHFKLSEKHIIKNLRSNFFYEKDTLKFDDIFCNLIEKQNLKTEFFNGNIRIKKLKSNYNTILKVQTKNISNLLIIPIMNFNFSEDNISVIQSNFTIKKNRSISFKNLSITNKNNYFTIKDLHLNKDYNLINFAEINVKTTIDKVINNDFKIINTDKINIKGKIFDAKKLIKVLSQDKKEDKFLKNISKDIEVDLDQVLKVAKFPIKKFRLIGTIQKGSFEKISAKSDFTENKHLDISLKKQIKTNKKILEVYSDIALPLLNDYNFFQGLEGGNLNYVSTFDKKSSSNLLTINNFKLNKAPVLAKILSLADLKGLTDTLKGNGISFDTLSIKYKSNNFQLDIEEIFMIGPSISILIDGYVEKKSGLISLRGTLVPAKTLNKLISKIPVVGDILIGNQVGEGVFGISFKVKGLPDNLKTTVNPVKTLTPRFITRALESAKKNK